MLRWLRRHWRKLAAALVAGLGLAAFEYFGDVLYRPSAWLPFSGLRAWIDPDISTRAPPTYHGSDGLTLETYDLNGPFGILTTDGIWIKACDATGCGSGAWTRDVSNIRFAPRGTRDVEVIMLDIDEVIYRNSARPVPKPVIRFGETVFEYALPIINGRTLYFISRNNSLGVPPDGPAVGALDWADPPGFND
jgi:hypothetical protein